MRNQGTIRVSLGLLSGFALWLMWRAWNLTPPEIESIRMRYAIASALFGQSPPVSDCMTVDDWRGLLPLSLLFSVLFAALNPLPRFILLLAAAFIGTVVGLSYYHSLRVIVPLGGPAIMLTCAYICGSLIHVEVEKIERNRNAAIEAELSAEAERKRIVRDLHDDCLSSMSNVIRLADGLRAEYPDNETTREIRANLESTITRIRRVINDLYPTILEEFGLIVALEHLTEDFQKQIRIPCAFDHADTFTFSKLEQLCLYRIVQESLANIHKHANATEVRVSLNQHGQRILLTIEDNGAGGKIETKHDSFGLRNIQERARLINATIHFLPAVSFPHGTLVRVELPTAAQPQAASETGSLQKECYAAPDS